MRINFSKPLNDLEGAPLVVPGSLIPMTLSSVCVTALVTLSQDDQNVDAKTKYDWGHLANQIYGKNELELSTEQIVLLKNRIGKLYGPLIVAQAWDLLEGA